MTKNEILTKVGKRLGDTSSNFLSELLSPLYDDVVNELAAEDCIKSLNRTNVFTITTAVTDYALPDICGLNPGVYPLDVRKIIVPSWGITGILERVEDSEFDRWRVSYTDNSGAATPGLPARWRLDLAGQTLQLHPQPDRDATDAEISFIAPPTVLSDSDDLAEIRQEHIPVIIAGMIKYGLVYQDETIENLFDSRTAAPFFELAKVRMRSRAERVIAKTARMRFRDF